MSAGPTHKDPQLKRLENLLALCLARVATALSSLSKQRLVLQSTDNIPELLGPTTIYVGQGATGVPAPATYTSVTGNVRVMIQVSVLPATGGDNVAFQPVRDNGTPGQTDVGTFGQTTAQGAEQQQCIATLIIFDSVPAGTPHAWGVLISASNPGGADELQVQGGQFQISIEDL